jgi:hypothetical protein
MDLDQTSSEFIEPLPSSPLTKPINVATYLIHRTLIVLMVAYVVAEFVGVNYIPPNEERQRQLSMIVAGWGFDLLSWEVQAWGDKLGAIWRQPTRNLDVAAQNKLVRDYLDRAQKIRHNEHEINRILSEQQHKLTPQSTQLQIEINQLRQQQAADRGAVEQVLAGQISHELVTEGIQFAGISLPPVEFAFVEPPRKLVVSPRDQIATIYSEMLDATMNLEQVEHAEQTIRQKQNLSAYITDIGGLGAYPTMVVDSAALPWILSTVAHEWTHNYLSFFPLGFNYGATDAITIINETVADIVGNEVGDRALRQHYPDLAPPPPADTQTPAPPPPPTFDFNAEMRQTRVTVDQLLRLGQVEEAERYMELRRQYFVENGYALRVLNQAYFAFHGSYGTGAASTSPIGPKLEQLRTLTPDIHTFLTTVRSFTQESDLDAALKQWEAHGKP